MKIYCQKCGTGSEYSFDKPKFCSNCGSGFSIAHSPAPKVNKPAPTKITQVTDEEEIGDERVPDISQLEFEMDVPANKPVKLQNLMGTSNGQGLEERFSQGQRVNKSEAMESFKKEAGFYPSRPHMNEEE